MRECRYRKEYTVEGLFEVRLVVNIKSMRIEGMTLNKKINKNLVDSERF